MADYFFPLKDRFEVAEGTTAFVFSTDSNFTFRAGQYVEIGLDNPPYKDEKKNHREFSIVSSPQEKGILMIATRMRDSAFKRSLKEIPIGTIAKVEGPFGDFSLHENASKKAVFISGGIGVTPVMSIVKDATERKLPHEIILINSNTTPQRTPFLKDFQELTKENPHFKFFPRMTDAEGYVDADFIKNCVRSLDNSIYYVAGPPNLVLAMTKILEGLGVSRDDIRFEEFSGY